MKLLYIYFFLIISSPYIYGQLVINELDADTPSTDKMEFIELKSDAPDFALDGFVVVAFNGSTSGRDASYLAYDLDGYTTDSNGIFVLGGPELSPVPQLVFYESTIQNGADAVAIYQGDATDFKEGTIATTTHLIDALAYDTDDADDINLMMLLAISEQINENVNNNKTTESIQRKNDGSYEVKAPTPGIPNDGTGTQFNGITISTTLNQYNEGAMIDIVFTTTTNVVSDLSFDFSITYQGFTIADYIGTTSITIPTGMRTGQTTIQIIDDIDNEGDEVMDITFGTIPPEFVRLNDHQKIRIIDNDFTTANWGSPLVPTFGKVTSTAPNTYYTPLEGLTGETLKQAIQDIIADPMVIRAHTYADIIDILKEADQSPLNSNQVWLLYSEEQRPKFNFQTSGGSNTGKWNREHTYPRSRGHFFSIEADDIADGIAIYTTTNADSLRHANSDAHGLRATDGPENSARGNKDYGEYNGPTENQGSWKGDVARSVLFLTIRYNGLEVISDNPPNNTVGQLGDLDTLLDWHRNDPPDDFEMNRNNVIYNWQLNRNPFIDHPNLVEYIWGNRVGETWHPTLSITDTTISSILITPNPTTGILSLYDVSETGFVEVYTITGKKILSLDLDKNMRLNLENVANGTYLLRIHTKNYHEVIKINKYE